MTLGKALASSHFLPGTCSESVSQRGWSTLAGKPCAPRDIALGIRGSLPRPALQGLCMLVSRGPGKS